MTDEERAEWKAFSTARSFSRAAGILIDRYTKAEERDLIAPVVVNSVLAVELYLKCLLLLEGKSPVRTHKLKDLYGRLDGAHRSAVERYYDEDVATKPYVKRMEAADPGWRYKVSDV